MSVFVFVCHETGSHYVAPLAWNLLETWLVLNPQISACFCLPGATIRGVHQLVMVSLNLSTRHKVESPLGRVLMKSHLHQVGLWACLWGQS